MSITAQTPTAVETDQHTSSSELRTALDDLAFDVAENGTESRRPTLEMLATVSHRATPGAAAALVHWAGTEIARLRAFATVHRAVRYELDDEERELTAMGVSPAIFYRLVA